MSGPLEGIRIIECAHVMAGPYAGTLLADFGADVIKVERPGEGDSLRSMGPKHEGTGVWWSVSGRNKRSVCIDIKTEEGHAIFRDLLSKADVLTENFRPGVMARLGLSWERLHEEYPRLIMLSISGFGQTGPYRERGGFGKIAEAFSGATFLTGDRDGVPSHPGYSLADGVTGLTGAFAIMLALRERERSGQGQQIDLALYEPMLRMIEWQLPLYLLTGQVPMRNGPRFPFDRAFLTDICATADGEMVVVSAATSDSLARLRELLTEEGVLKPDADEGVGALEDALRVWIGRTKRDEVLSRLAAERLVGGPVCSAADLAVDEHVRERGNIQWVPNPQGGNIPMPGVIPKLSATPGDIRRAGPSLGQDTKEVLVDVLAYQADHIERLFASGIVA